MKKNKQKIILNTKYSSFFTEKQTVRFIEESDLVKYGNMIILQKYLNEE